MMTSTQDQYLPYCRHCVGTPSIEALAVVTSDYTATKEDEMSLKKGEFIDITLFLEENRLMGKKVFLDREVGCFPSSHVKFIAPSTPKKGRFCIAEYGYQGSNEDELSFAENEIIKIWNISNDSGWLFGELKSSKKLGIFPINFVKFLTDDEANIELEKMKENGEAFTRASFEHEDEEGI